MEFLVAALILGAAGSLHCVGMCGPIALALPVHQFGLARKSFSILIYQAGRIISYASLGLVFALLGAGIALAGYQQMLSVILGLMLLLGVLFSTGLSGNRLTGMLGTFTKKLYGRFLGRKNIPAFFFTGMLNGLLPCGMLYAALAGATVSPDVSTGVFFMVAFGLGTIPALVSISLLSSVSSGLRTVLRKVSPALTMIMGVLLILRGLGLGIPLISPEINRQHQIEECSHPLQTNNHEQNSDR